MTGERLAPNLEDYIRTYGPEFGPEFYYEALEGAKFKQQLPQILQDLEPVVTPVEGKKPFSLVAMMFRPGQAFTLTHPSWTGNERTIDEIMESAQVKYGLKIAKKTMGDYKFLIRGWFAYNSERFNPSSKLGGARMKAKLLKTFLLPPK